MKGEKIYLADKLTDPIANIIRGEKSGGIILGIFVLIALVLANSPLSDAYFNILDYKLGLPWVEDYFRRFAGVSNWVEENFSGLGQYLGIPFTGGAPHLEFTVSHLINDGLMAIFFFTVGLELKREIFGGELSSPRKAILPIAAAIGGMIVPACIYFLWNRGGEPANGWGIPMATDIAFALGVLYLLGKRAPVSLKIFLTALAIVDDLGAVLVIAFFYTSSISFVNLLIGALIIGFMWLMNRIGVRWLPFYAILGIAGVWVAFLLSGVHATIAAVAAAFTIPYDLKMNPAYYAKKINEYLDKLKKISDYNESTADVKAERLPEEDNEQPRKIKAPIGAQETTVSKANTHFLEKDKDMTEVRDASTANKCSEASPKKVRLSEEQVALLEEIRKNTHKVIPPLHQLEQAMLPFAIFVVLPVFALANAGVSITNIRLDQFYGSVTLGVALGLFVGKILGVVGTTWLMVKLKIATFPEGMNGKHLFGLGLLASIGFTMSMFITSLAFTNPDYAVEAKVGIFVASILGGILGYWWLSRIDKKLK
ncbi:MAG: Na+/H+ antiporter NhaA [Tannerellaceae bacterium]|jgi:NhaA family Na+:H+ antiporter|nr:Na+/H+ antiporter NhaA [Tannerellaceae bacterium]